MISEQTSHPSLSLFVPDECSKTLIQCEGCNNYFECMDTFKRHPCTEATTSNTSENLAAEAEKGTIWNESQTLLLFDCYKQYIDLVNKGKLKKKTMWDTICRKFKEMGYSFSSEQICGRWKSLLRAYKNSKDSNKKSGNCRKIFEYETQLDELLANDPTIEPECTLSSTSTTVSKRPAAGDPDQGDGNSNSTLEPPTKKRASRSNASELVSLFKNYLDDQKEKEKEEREKREQMHNEKLNAMNNLIAAISSNRGNSQPCHHSKRNWEPIN